MVKLKPGVKLKSGYTLKKEDPNRTLEKRREELRKVKRTQYA